MYLFLGGILFSLLLWWAFYSGWKMAHLDVADECEKLGKFYVRDKVYECTLIKEVENNGKHQ